MGSSRLPSPRPRRLTSCPPSPTGPGSSLICMWHALLMTLLIGFHVTQGADLVYTIREELPPLEHIGNLAKDTDLNQYVSADSFSTLRYSFLAGETSYTSLFHLDEGTGDLATARTGRLDRESVCPFSKECVLPLQVAIQSTLNQFFRKVSVDINVTDINDNPPTFPVNSTVVHISESVAVPSSLPLMSAVDRDTGANNSLKDYQLIPADGPFGIAFTPSSPNLRLVVREELDHERQSRYQVQVVARDGGSPPQQGVLIVNITVDDENDNEPRFTEPSYSATVDEDAEMGHVLLTVTATDLDGGLNGQVRYRLSSQQSQTVLSMFAVDAATGQLTVAGDIENGDQEHYEIVVEASDMGAQPFTTSTTVTVTVRDTINSPPKMTVSLLTGNGYSTISEYASLGAVVAHIAVKDGDRGRNGIVQCEIQHHPYFELQGFDVNEYKVIVARALDRETVSAHNVTVFCTDAGVRPLTASASFEVRVLDENDNSPKFVQPEYRVSLPENSMEGLSLLTVQATDLDADMNGKVRYSLHPNARGRFLISPDTGIIRTHDDFDYELEQTFNFTVIATDRGDPPRSDTARVVVLITDVNDQKPSFARDVFPFTISESAPPGTRVGSRLTANDFESGLNGQVEIFADRVSILGTPFDVHPNGTIYLTGRLDYESLTYYYFKVIARDKGSPPLNDTAEVQISVLDENDNRPRITYPANGSALVLFVSMDDDIAKPVAMLKADDPDSGLNGQVQFIITSRNDSGRFDVDSNSGEVFITRSITRNDINTYRLQVLVQDSGSPPQPAERTLTVWIHAGNGTRSGGQGGESDQYILITLAIVCITIILSAVIVLVIVIMRRMDRRRKPPGGPMHIQNARVLGSYTDRVKADNIHNESMDGGLGDKEYGGGFGTFGKGMASEDEDFGFGGMGGCKMDGVGGSAGHTLNMSSSDDFKSPAPTDAATGSSTAQHPVTVSQDSDLDLEALQLHQVLLQSYHDSTGPAGDSWQPAVRAQEDGQSDSSGETIPSDSGRGGSEEDISHSGHVPMGLNDDLRLAALHDASFQSISSNTYPGTGGLYPHNPSKSSVRDPVRSSGRKHVTFKDISAAKRGVRPAATTAGVGSTTIPSTDSPRGNTSGPSAREGNGTRVSTSSPRYTQLPRSSVAQNSGSVSGSRDTLDSPRGSLTGQLESPRSPRLAGASGTGNANCLDSPRVMSQPHQQESPLTQTMPIYANEPQKGGSGTTTNSKDWSRPPVLIPSCDSPVYSPTQDSIYAGQAPRSSFKSSQELQTFHPPRNSVPVKQSGSREYLVQHPGHRSQRDTGLGSRDPRSHPGKDWRNDSFATTDDCDDQRSTTTTSGSYTIDNEDTYVGLHDLTHSPWKDVVV